MDQMVDAKKEYGYRLTTQTPAGKENDPVLFPGWRGQHDDWGSIVPAYANENMTNVAIKGLFTYIDPSSDEAKALEADGYVKTPWAIDMLNYEDSYATKLLQVIPMQTMQQKIHLSILCPIHIRYF